MNIGPNQVNFNKGFLDSAPQGEGFQAIDRHDYRVRKEHSQSLESVTRLDLAN